MRSLVADIFHSLSTKQLFAVVGEFIVLRTPDHADRRIGCRRQFDPSFRRAAGFVVCNSSPACSGRG